MREIGGYLELERLEGREYHEKAFKINCGRNAILLSARLRKVQRVFLPYYLCGSVANALERDGFTVVYYRIDDQFQPVYPDACGKEDMLVAVNYYGQLDVRGFVRKYGEFTNIVIDNTQAFFEKNVENADSVCSCRKYFGVPDGAYLYTECTSHMPELEPERVAQRCGHLLGRMENSAGEFLEVHRENDRTFALRPLGAMSAFTENILRAVDYEQVRSRRNTNYRILREGLDHRNRLELIPPDGPFAYPFYVENGPRVRKMLAQEKIYIPTLWPNVLELPEDWIERKYAENILPLPCDQRYYEGDMRRILEVLDVCISSEK